jgi:hypothetical protein
VAYSSYIRQSRFGDWQKVTPKLTVDFLQIGATLLDLAVPFHPRKDNAPARFSFSKSIFRFHDPSFCCLVSVIRARGRQRNIFPFLTLSTMAGSCFPDTMDSWLEAHRKAASEGVRQTAIGGPGSGEELYPISFAAARTSEMMLSTSASVVR